MPKYLYQISYTPPGAAGLLRDGGTKRRAAVVELVESLGGTVDAMYFAFGETDAYVVAELPDHAAAAAASLVTRAAGGVSGYTTVLLTPEDVDDASRKEIVYTPPGQ